MSNAALRIRCTLDNASPCINGVRFGRVQHESGEVFHVSEPIAGDRAAAFLKIPGYEPFTGGDIAEAAIDAAIAAAAADEAAAAPSGSPAGLERTVAELQRANLALSAELSELRAAKGDPAAVAETAAEVRRLTADLATAQARIDELTADLARAQGRVVELEKANAALAGDAGGAPAAGGGAKGETKGKK